MLVTVLGISILFSFVHCTKASVPITSSPSANVILSSAKHQPKPFAGISFNFAGRVIWVRLVHLLNVANPIFYIESGKLIFTRLLHSANAWEPISVNPSGSTTPSK